MSHSHAHSPPSRRPKLLNENEDVVENTGGQDLAITPGKRSRTKNVEDEDEEVIVSPAKRRRSSVVMKGGQGVDYRGIVEDDVSTTLLTDQGYKGMSIL